MSPSGLQSGGSIQTNFRFRPCKVMQPPCADASWQSRLHLIEDDYTVTVRLHTDGPQKRSARCKLLRGRAEVKLLLDIMDVQQCRTEVVMKPARFYTLISSSFKTVSGLLCYYARY